MNLLIANGNRACCFNVTNLHIIKRLYSSFSMDALLFLIPRRFCLVQPKRQQLVL